MSFESWRISRRTFSRFLAGFVVASSSAAIAQASKAVRRIGLLEPGAPDNSPEDVWAERLREIGWVEGQNLKVERRYANGRLETLQPLAEELVRARVEIVVTRGTPATLAAKRATTTIPIVFVSAGDPVLVGLVASLAQPGGNVTGYSIASPEVTSKRLSLLKELLPLMQRIGALWDARNPLNQATRGQFERVCQSLGLEPIVVEIGAADEFRGAIEQLTRQRAQALHLDSDFIWEHRFEVVDAATKRDLPTMADDEEMARSAGALCAYSPTLDEASHIRAYHIDRILRGARPTDLPVRQPTKFVLVINLKTARALGLAIPRQLLLRADEVIR